MNTEQLISALGVRCVDAREVVYSSRASTVYSKVANAGFDIIGDAPTIDAWLVRKQEEICVACLKWPPDHNALHEAIHAVLGTPSLDDETILMAYEQAVARELTGEDYSSWRESFGDFGVDFRGYYEVGHDDEIFQTPGWKAYQQKAIEAGVMMPDGRPIYGFGVHESFEL